MARPLKNNADYFTHDNDMRNDEKIKAVRRKYSHLGYSIWSMTLEKLCKSNNFELSLAKINLELLAGDFEIEPKQLKEILDYFISIDLLQQEKEIIYSLELIKRFEGLLRRRKHQRSGVIGVDNPAQVELSTAETHKGKERKLKKRKDKKEGEVSPRDYFYSTFKEKRGIRYVASFAKDGAIFKGISKVLSDKETKWCIDKFFDSDDAFIRKSDYGVGVFKTQINKLRQGKSKNKELGRSPDGTTDFKKTIEKAKEKIKKEGRFSGGVLRKKEK